MSRGPGKLQAAILDRLHHKGCKVYTGGALTTAELTDELQAAGLVPADRRAAAFRVYRAARSLYWRKLITAEWVDYGERSCGWTWHPSTPDQVSVDSVEPKA